MFKSNSAQYAIILIILPLLTAGSAFGLVTLDQDFDSGNLHEATSTVNMANPLAPAITLNPRNTYSPPSWGRFYFQASGVNGTTPTFTASQSDAYAGGQTSNAHRSYYSYDQTTWTQFDNGSAVGGGNLTFSNNSPFTQNSVYIAQEIPYAMSRVDSRTAGLISSPWVHSTATGNASLVVATTPGGYLDDLGRTVASQNIYGYRITDASSPFAKTKVGVIAGNHSGEIYGDWAVEGLVDFLTGGSAEAAIVRQHYDFYVYPNVDPEGRFVGNFRSSPSNAGRNHNRIWGNNDPTAGYGALNPEVALVEAAMLADTGGTVDYFFDFHDSGLIEDNEVLMNTAMYNSPFALFLAARDPEGAHRGTQPGRGATPFNPHTGYAQAWASDDPNGLHATYSSTPELWGVGAAGIPRLKEFGENFGLAFNDLVPEPASMSLLALGGLAMLRRRR